MLEGTVEREVTLELRDGAMGHSVVFNKGSKVLVLIVVDDTADENEQEVQRGSTE